MFENFHPGFIFFLVGLFACVGSDKLRKMILACGPFLALVAIFNLPLGLEQNFTFLQDWTSHYMYVDKLSWVFGLVFCIMGCIGGVFSWRPSAAWVTWGLPFAAPSPMTGSPSCSSGN